MSYSSIKHWAQFTLRALLPVAVAVFAMAPFTAHSLTINLGELSAGSSVDVTDSLPLPPGGPETLTFSLAGDATYSVSFTNTFEDTAGQPIDLLNNSNFFSGPQTLALGESFTVIVDSTGPIETFSLELFQYGPDDVLNVSVQAVPIPAAAWLFGSALFGIGALARRRRGA